MITIYAEKPDVGKKIAAALDVITLHNGTKVSYEELAKYKGQIASQQHKDGFLKISYMGEDCYVTWGYGHMFELKQAKDYDEDYKNWSQMPMPFFPENWEVKPYADKTAQIKIVKDLFKKSHLVINATDDDREGDLIFWYLCVGIGYNKDFKRAIFSSQEKNVFKESFEFKNLLSKKDILPRTMAGMARSEADAAVGWNVTALMTLKASAGKGDIWSYGRVQTPVQNLIVTREKEIRNFKPVTYFKLTGEFTTIKGESYKGIHKTAIPDEKTADKMLNDLKSAKAIVSDIKEEKGVKINPELYSLSALQMEANERFGFTMDQTLETAQQLYEMGVTTYPRTDSRYLTDDMVSSTLSMIQKLKAIPEYTRFIDGKSAILNEKRYFNSAKVGSHFAIIPTGAIPKNLTDVQKKLYDIIAKSVIIMLYPSAKIKKVTVTTDAGIPFTTIGVTVEEHGWMAVDSSVKEKVLPHLSCKEEVKGKYKKEEKQTEPPKRYTDKTLLAAMISVGKTVSDKELKAILADPSVQGIGTEATRAGIINTLVERGYIQRKGKTIYPTEKGISVIDNMPISDIKLADMTAKWEKKMTEIEKGTCKLDFFINEVEQTVKKWISDIQSSVHCTARKSSVAGTDLMCPLCHKELISYSWGYGCSGYKEGCKVRIGKKIAGKTISDAVIKKLLKEKKTNTIKGFTSKNGKKFDAALELKDDGTIGFIFSDKK